MNQPAGLLGRKSSFRSKSKAIWFKILIKVAMFISYIRLYFLITVPKENLGRQKGGKKLALKPSLVHLNKV